MGRVWLICHFTVTLACCWLAFCGSSFASDRDIKETQFGTARILGDKHYGEKCLYFNTKLLHCSKQDHFYFEGVIKTLRFSIIFLAEDCGGSACGTPEISFLLASNSNATYEGDYQQYSWDINSAKINFNSDKFSIIGHPLDGYSHRLNFSNGIFSYFKVTSRKNTTLEKSECDYLYSSVLENCSNLEGNCKSPIDEVSHATLRGYVSVFRSHYGFHKNEFEKLCRQSCITRNLIERKKFDKQFCNKP